MHTSRSITRLAPPHVIDKLFQEKDALTLKKPSRPYSKRRKMRRLIDCPSCASPKRIGICCPSCGGMKDA